MPNRFDDVTNEELNMVDKVIKDAFPELVAARFLMFFDNKKRKTKGKYVIGRIKKLNEEQRIMTMDENGGEYHYTIFLDKFIWDNLTEPDQIKILRRLMCQCDIDHEGDDPYKMQDYEVQDFYSEIQYNHDDPRWLERVELIAENLYEEDGD